MGLLLTGSGLVLGLAACAHSQAPELVGRWRVEFKLSSVEERVVQFDAKPAGKGSFLLLDPTSDLIPPAEPTSARWAEAPPDRVTFSGEIEFPIGNVGRDAGTLVFRGVLDSADSISGWVGFFREGQDPNHPGAAPARAGSFTAHRVRDRSGVVERRDAALHRHDL